MSEPPKIETESPPPKNRIWRILLALVLVVMCVPLGGLWCLALVSIPVGMANWRNALIFPAQVIAFTVAIAWCIWGAVVLFRKPRMPREGDASPIRWKWTVAKIVAAFVICGALLADMPIFTFAGSLLLLKHSAGRFDREYNTALVEQVRRQDFKGEQLFTLDSQGNMEKQAGTEDGKIWARRDTDGTLCLSIMTVDQGTTAASYGFAYSDKLLRGEKDKDSPEGSSQVHLDVPEPFCYAFPEDRIDDHWWRVNNGMP